MNDNAEQITKIESILDRVMVVSVLVNKAAVDVQWEFLGTSQSSRRGRDRAMSIKRKHDRLARLEHEIEDTYCEYHDLLFKLCGK